MSQITLDIAPEVLLGLRVPLENAGDTVRMAAAVKLYELGRLSSGAAARLAGVPMPTAAGTLSSWRDWRIMGWIRFS